MRILRGDYEDFAWRFLRADYKQHFLSKFTDEWIDAISVSFILYCLSLILRVIVVEITIYNDTPPFGSQTLASEDWNIFQTFDPITNQNNFGQILYKITSIN